MFDCSGVSGAVLVLVFPALVVLPAALAVPCNNILYRMSNYPCPISCYNLSTLIVQKNMVQPRVSEPARFDIAPAPVTIIKRLQLHI